MKRILMLAPGGPIASKESGQGLSPVITSEEILRYVPDIGTLCQVGRQVKKRYPILEAYNMTMEAAVTKLMWVLGQTNRPKEVRELFYHMVQFDLIRG